MKAAVVTRLGTLEVLDVPQPVVGEYDALCEMRYGSTCAGTDIHLMDGLHPNPVAFPTVLGHESVGRVVAVGSRVRNYRVGDLVTRVGAPAGLLEGLGSNWGGFAQYGIARDHWQMRSDGVAESEWARYRVNQIVAPQIDEKAAPMIITWRETLSYIRRIGVRAGQRVIVIGSGANALSLTAHCCNTGAFVVCVGSASREADFRKLSIADYLNYKDPQLAAQYAERFSGASVDFLIDGVGADKTVNMLLPFLKEEGVLGNYGWNGRFTYALNPFCAKRSFRVYAGGYDEEESNGEVQSLVLQGKLRAELWYDMQKPFALDDISAVYDSLRRHEALKYLIKL